MKTINKLKNNRIIRGVYFLLSNYFGWKKSKFGYIADNVIVTPPSMAIGVTFISTMV